MATSTLAGLLPSSGTWFDGVRDALAQEPATVASVLHGLLVGPIMPPLTDRRAMTLPTLVVGHEADPLHPDADAAALTRQLPAARLVRGRTIADLRLDQARLAEHVATFADDARRR